ncbi:MAG TPA: HAD-IA family hydrolase [Opitutus sp.]|nr:HAD-IA family hydrolase [Opitutus sp.]
MSGSVRAVVFDLDGTLVDSMPLVLRAYAHALQPFYPNLTDEEITARLGGPPERMFAEMLVEPECAETALRRLKECSLANWKLIRPFTGMAALLADLRAAGCASAIWTGRERESAEWLLREHGIAPQVQTFVCGDDLATHKPDPAGLAEVLHRLDVPVGETLFVGDADVDVLAGAAIGVRTLLIHHGRPLDATVRAKAWRVAVSPSEAYAIVRGELPPQRSVVAGG